MSAGCRNKFVGKIQDTCETKNLGETGRTILFAFTTRTVNARHSELAPTSAISVAK